METAQDVLDYLREQEQALVGLLERLALAASPRRSRPRKTRC